MVAIHQHPHRLAGKYVNDNTSIACRRYGRLRVEDWHDRIVGESWLPRATRGETIESQYSAMIADVNADRDTNLLDEEYHRTRRQEVVRCHVDGDGSGQVVLVHNSWLPDKAEGE